MAVPERKRPTGRGQGRVCAGSRQGSVGPRQCVCTSCTFIFQRRHFESIFLPPSSQWRSSSLLIVDTATQLSLLALSPLLALTSLTPLPSLYAFVLWFAMGACNLFYFLYAQGSGLARCCFRQVFHFLRCLVLSSLKFLFAFCLQTTAVGLGLVLLICL